MARDNKEKKTKTMKQQTQMITNHHKYKSLKHNTSHKLDSRTFQEAIKFISINNYHITGMFVKQLDISK